MRRQTAGWRPVGVLPVALGLLLALPAAASTDSIAVIGFSNISGAAEDDWIGASIAESLATGLPGRYVVISRARVSDTAHEASGGGGAAATDEEVEVGRRLGVRYVVSGAYQRLGDVLRINGRFVDVATGAVVRSARVDGALDDLFSLQDRVVAELSGPSPGAAAGAPPPARGRLGAPVTVAGVIVPPSALQPGDRFVRHLSVDEAVTLALEQNLDLRVERINPQIQDLSIAEARSVYVPTLSTTFISDNQNNPNNSFLSGGGAASNTVFQQLQDTVQVVQELPWAGGRYSASWDGTRSTTTSIFTAVDPQLRSNFRLNYTQPLLRNLSIDGPRQQIAITRANREISSIQLRRAIVQTRRTVRNAYWDLVFAQSFLEVQRQSLELAQELLRGNRRRVEVGSMAPIDIVQAESEVARNEGGGHPRRGRRR